MRPTRHKKTRSPVGGLIRFYHEIAGVGLVFPRADRPIAVEGVGMGLIVLRPIEGLEFVEAAVPAVAEGHRGPFNRAPLVSQTICPDRLRKTSLYSRGWPAKFSHCVQEISEGPIP